MSDISCMRITILLLGSFLLSGCVMQNQNPGALQGVSSSAVDQLNADHGHFDTIKDPPFTAHTRFAAGQLAESQGAIPMAIEQYKAALKLDPKHQPSLYRLGVLYAQNHQFDLAISSWKQYVKATGDSATAMGNLAFCYELAGRTSDAENAYKAGIQKEPANQSCRVNFGLMLARQGRVDEAKTQWAAVLKPAEVHYNLASVYEQLGRKDDAKSEYEKALELNPEFWEAQTRLSRLE